VIASCEIHGSADSSIKNAVANDLSVILSRAKIEKILVNGKTAEKYYNKYIKNQIGVDAICLPSTSPANAAWRLSHVFDPFNSIVKKLLFFFLKKVCPKSRWNITAGHKKRRRGRPVLGIKIVVLKKATKLRNFLYKKKNHGITFGETEKVPVFRKKRGLFLWKILRFLFSALFGEDVDEHQRAHQQQEGIEEEGNDLEGRDGMAQLIGR